MPTCSDQVVYRPGFYTSSQNMSSATFKPPVRNITANLSNVLNVNGTTSHVATQKNTRRPQRKWLIMALAIVGVFAAIVGGCVAYALLATSSTSMLERNYTDEEAH
ncbi:unnamed protein product [Rotaria socialis]|uniref:Uncharacterized protein n=1 Tax=Rotaria socialis TaxID=392032 RepID=A0A817XWG0_9BILA|nr:unnamed protein product [Rotaria socialis]CAF4357869.1 unnamed protein product [Rotaria socialis]